MLLSVPDPASTDVILVSGESVPQFAPPYNHARSTIERDGKVITGFRKPATDEATYLVRLERLVQPAHIIEALAWVAVPALVTGVQFDGQRVSVSVWGGSTAGRHTVHLSVLCSDDRQIDTAFAIHVDGTFSFYGAEEDDFSGIEGAMNKIVNITLPSYDFSSWSE